MADFLAPNGPLWGPDFVTVTVQQDGAEYDLEVYPDVNNPELRAAGLQTQYYWQPQQVYCVKRMGDPADYDFAMTVFKGLMTSDRDIGVTTAEQDAGGGWCSFSTTFAPPAGVITQALTQIQQHSHPAPSPTMAQYFNYQSGDIVPNLGVVTISEDDVTINVPDLTKATPGMFIEAVCSSKGSIEAAGVNSFLVTCNQMAAGAISGSLTAGGASPFTIFCALQQQFWMDACTVEVTCDVDKVYDSVSVAVQSSGFLGLCSGSLNAAYSNMQTNGAIQTKITMDSGMLTAAQQQWIQTYVTDIQTQMWDMVKTDIFDWDPSKTDTTASASQPSGLFAGLFGGASVSVKADYQRRGVSLSDSLELSGPIAVTNVVQGDLNEIMTAVKANLSKYLAIVDIGQYFQKVQVAATCAVEFAGTTTAADGTDVSDPITSVQLEVAYPDYNEPLNTTNQTPNLVVAAQGFHYQLGATQTPPAAAQPIIWTASDRGDAISAGWLRLQNAVQGWPQGQVQLTKTFVFAEGDSRVDLASGGTEWSQTYTTSTELAPIMTHDAVGYVFVHFLVPVQLPPNITLTVTLVLGPRTDTLTITSTNQKNILWEIWSDKYFTETSFTYSVQVEVVGENFTDPPVVYQQPAPTQVKVPAGRIKYLNPYMLQIPACPSAQVQTVNQYIAAVRSAATAQPVTA